MLAILHHFVLNSKYKHEMPKSWFSNTLVTGTEDVSYICLNWTMHTFSEHSHHQSFGDSFNVQCTWLIQNYVYQMLSWLSSKLLEGRNSTFTRPKVHLSSNSRRRACQCLCATSSSKSSKRNSWFHKKDFLFPLVHSSRMKFDWDPVCVKFVQIASSKAGGRKW